MITHNLRQVREALQKANKNVDEGARNARDEMMATLIQLSKEQIEGRRGKDEFGRWEKAQSGQPPMNRTGNLRRSIRGQKYNVGFAKYEAIVGPTIVYGRAVELGGGFAPKSWRGTSAMKGFPYMAPAYARFRVLAPGIVRKHLAIGGK
jgi:hypothetical protein